MKNTYGKGFSKGYNNECKPCLLYDRDGRQYEVVDNHDNAYLFKPNYGTLLWGVGININEDNEKMYLCNDEEKAKNLFSKIIKKY